MSQHQFFRRAAVNPQAAQQLQTTVIPAPTRGLILNENFSFMQPGGAVVLDNWRPTLKGLKLRGGSLTHCTLPETTPVYSAFEYVTSSVSKIFAGNATKLYDVTAASPTLVKSGQGSGNYAAAQMSNASGQYLLVVNAAGDYPLQFDGTTWTTLNAAQINAASGSVTVGQNLVYVWKHRGRLFFIEGGTMNAWYLPTDSIQGTLLKVPLAGASTKGGHLLFGATWSLDAGDGTDDKCVFVTDLGECLIFSGSDPSSANTWKQDGRYQVPPPLGMNAHVNVGGELYIATVDGIVPISQSIQKDTAAQIDISAITAPIKSMWQTEVTNKRAWSWSMKVWEEYGAMFITLPGGPVGNRYCLLANSTTLAFSRYTNWDATCFMKLGSGMYFGTQDGKIVQMESTGKDDGNPYTATMVGGWEMFQSPANEIVLRQMRANFFTGSRETFQPQLNAATDYVVTIPSPPSAGPDPGPNNYWDGGLWDTAVWDAANSLPATITNTGWVSIGSMGFAHAPVLQATISQTTPPDVELVSITAVYERGGVNV